MRRNDNLHVGLGGSPLSVPVFVLAGRAHAHFKPLTAPCDWPLRSLAGKIPPWQADRRHDARICCEKSEYQFWLRERESCPTLSLCVRELLAAGALEKINNPRPQLWAVVCKPWIKFCFCESSYPKRRNELSDCKKAAGVWGPNIKLLIPSCAKQGNEMN